MKIYQPLNKQYMQQPPSPPQNERQQWEAQQQLRKERILKMRNQYTASQMPKYSEWVRLGYEDHPVYSMEIQNII